LYSLIFGVLYFPEFISVLLCLLVLFPEIYVHFETFSYDALHLRVQVSFQCIDRQCSHIHRTHQLTSPSTKLFLNLPKTKETSEKLQRVIWRPGLLWQWELRFPGWSVT